MITPRPSPDDSPPKPSFPSRPFWGIQPVLISAKVSSETFCGGEKLPPFAWELTADQHCKMASVSFKLADRPTNLPN